MNESAVRAIAQSNPVPTIAERWGEQAAITRLAVDTLIRNLRELDKITEQLAAHDLTVSTDLGPVGNAAASVRRDLERDRTGTRFEMPQAS